MLRILFGPRIASIWPPIFLWLYASTAVCQVVKIRSYPCGDQSRVRTGSGTILTGTPQGDVILTSSHVLYHGGAEDGICNEFRTETSSWQATTKLRVHSGRGLALLTPTPDFWQTHPDSIQWNAAITTKQGDPVTIAGFALASTTQAMTPGRVLALQSDRVLLPSIRGVTEVSGAHNEYGMSGGAMLSEDRAAYLGLVSHQYLRIEAGAPAVIDSLDGPGGSGQGSNQAGPQGELVALVIGLADIQDWFDALRSPGGELREDLRDQLKGVMSFVFGSLKFEALGCQGAGGIGGQGVGVGGDSGGALGTPAGVRSRVEGASGCMVHIQRVEATAANGQVWPLRDSVGWFEKLNQRLQFGQTAWFDDLHLREQHVSVRGLLYALTMMRRGFLPLVHDMGPIDRSVKDELAPYQEKLGRTLATLTQRLPGDASHPEEANSILLQLHFVESALNQNEWDLIDVEFVRRVIKVGDGGLYNKGWTYFFNQHFAESVDLVQTVTRICEILERAN